MSTFVQTFDKTKPLGSDLANTLDTVIQNLQYAISERYELEHIALDSSATGATESTNPQAQGRHNPGKVSAVYIGTTAQIAALTGMTSGALAYDTTLRVLKIYNGSNWTTYSVGGANDIFSGTELLVNIFGSAALAAAGMQVSLGWAVAPTTVENIFDRDSSTSWGATCRCACNTLVYWDLGAVYKGNIFVMCDNKTATLETSWVSPFCSYNTVPTSTLMPNSEIGISVNSVSHVTLTGIRPFYGRYVGLIWSASDGVNIYPNVRRFEVYGSAV